MVERAVRVVIPVLNRPERVGPLMRSLRSSQRNLPLLEVFIVTPGDDAEIAAIEAEGARYEVLPFHRRKGDYARKINFGANLEGEEEWIFTAADDLCFCVAWADIAIEGARRKRYQVIGTNDMANRRVMRGAHSTHSLVHRDYVAEGTIDEPGKIYHEGYDHNYCDDEMVHTARMRGRFWSCREAKVEHLHPMVRKAQDDATYKLGMRHFTADGVLFYKRQELWAPSHPHEALRRRREQRGRR